jgi:hypothetical protein
MFVKSLTELLIHLEVESAESETGIVHCNVEISGLWTCLSHEDIVNELGSEPKSSCRLQLDCERLE